ncbi:MAG: PaaI family thioesterase [Robiginitomaculum sp.]|nr:PaaI family thioesterase [Robiginitomaculum sp.]
MSDFHLNEAEIAVALDRIPYAKELAIRPLLMGDELTLILPYGPHIIGNPMLRALHGGAVGAFLETAAIVQLWLMGEPKPLPKPIGINLDYLRRGNPKDTFARAVVAKQGSRVANVRVRAWQDRYDEPISILHGHFLLAPKTEYKPGEKPDKK